MVIHVLQDCFATIPPFPYYLGDPDEFNLEQDLDHVMYGRPHGIYRVKLRPYTARLGDSTRDYEVDLVYFTAMISTCHQGFPIQCNLKLGSSCFMGLGPGPHLNLCFMWVMFQYLVQIGRAHV